MPLNTIKVTIELEMTVWCKSKGPVNPSLQKANPPTSVNASRWSPANLIGAMKGKGKDFSNIPRPVGWLLERLIRTGNDKHKHKGEEGKAAEEVEFIVDLTEEDCVSLAGSTIFDGESIHSGR